jgi:hypothetical protein
MAIELGCQERQALIDCVGWHVTGFLVARMGLVLVEHTESRHGGILRDRTGRIEIRGIVSSSIGIEIGDLGDVDTSFVNQQFRL